MSKRSAFQALDLISAYSEKKKAPYVMELSQIQPNPHQPRILGKDRVEDLVDSMSKLGLLEPILVRKDKSKFWIVAGERRYRAALQLGWKEIPAIVTEADEDVCYEMALAENEKRKNLNPWEVGKAIQYLRKTRNKTADEVAELLGYTARYVKQLSSIARLDQKTVQDLILSGKPASVKNLETLLKKKEKKTGGEIVSPSQESNLPSSIVLDLSLLVPKQRESFWKDWKQLKKKYGLE